LSTLPDRQVGLDTAEATVRLRQFGPNELASEQQRTSFRVAREILREPMFLLLIATGGVFLQIGGLHEALALMGGVLAIIVITFYQQQKTENTLAALRSLSSPQVLALREGKLQKTPARELVPGDIVLVAEGTRIPADGFLIDSTHLDL
jgi:Ca2+-transporting ATPase